MYLFPESFSADRRTRFCKRGAVARYSLSYLLKFYEYSRVGEELGEQFPEVDLRPVLELVIFTAEMVTPADSSESICGDPDDDKFFLCAISAPCKVIVSGDKHLLVKSGYAGVQVLKPRDFVEKILS